MMDSSTHLTFKFCDHRDIQPMIAWLSGAYADLQVQAQALVDDYWRRMKEEQKGRTGIDRGSLGLRLRARDNGAFSLEWYRMGHLRRSGRDISAEYIRRGQGPGYCKQTLLRGQPAWIENIVSDVEDALVEYRRRNAMIGKIRFAVVQYERKVTENKATQSPASRTTKTPFPRKKKST